MKLVNKILLSNIFLPIAAVILTVSTQIQLGKEPQWQPYLMLIFLATIFEYNRHRITDLISNAEDLKSEKYHWLYKNSKKIFLLVIIWIISFIVTVFFTKHEVLLALVPLGIVTIFYSVPVIGNKYYLFRLRQIPYLKIFLIAFVWSASTILIPVIHSGENIFNSQVYMLFAERFFFIFAITIPFDIRDLKTDRESGLKTFPMLANKNKILILSFLSLAICLILSFFHYGLQNNWFIIIALFISLITTSILLKSKFFRNLGRYYYQLLDGTIILQGILVLFFYFFHQN